MITIKVRQNGSLLVDGEEVRLVDWNGDEYAITKRPFSLCRCGHSTRKPFCDGTHSRIGFQAAEAALGPAAVDKPASAAGVDGSGTGGAAASATVPAASGTPAAEATSAALGVQGLPETPVE